MVDHLIPAAVIVVAERGVVIERVGDLGQQPLGVVGEATISDFDIVCLE